MAVETLNRQIRVFISSTFRDMQTERDYLVKFIFPQLRKLCESRGVTWGEVDLRWGVTDEQAAEGKVLPICLEEIKRCRPYFIGLLGERYGWIPDALPADLIEREPWLAEHLHGKTSVTELEILHGVLRNPRMAGHAYFYFRDPKYVGTLGDEGNAFAAEKLRTLKENIRRSGFPVRENYPDPKTLGELVLADFTKVINELFPEGSQPNPLDREALDHEAYAQSRERVYIGRQAYFDRLDSFVSGSDARVSSPPRPEQHAMGGHGSSEPGHENKPLVILGESGSGKSALLANWVARHRRAHPDALVLQHYIGATPYSTDWAAMLRRFMGEFKRRLGIQQDIPDQPDALRSAFPNWLYMAAAKGRIVLVLDALNQLEDRDGAPDLVWLPPVMPENVRLIVSTLPGRPLDEIEKRNWPTLKVELLSAAERRTLIAEYLAQHAKSLSTVRGERITAAPQSANPLYLRVLLDEMRLFGQHDRLDERIGDYLKAKSPYELYEIVVARWVQDYGGDSNLVGDTLSLLWAARRGLTETELLQALGNEVQPLPRANWSPLFLAMSDALVSRGGLLTFAHDFLRKAVQAARLPTEQKQQEAHLRLARYFEGQPATPRRTDELPWQLAEGRAWQRLRDLLADRAFLAHAWECNPFEVKAYWAQIEASSPQSMVETYRAQIQYPNLEFDKHHLWRLSRLLNDTGHPEEALPLCGALLEHFRITGDGNSLQAMYCDQANLLRDRGDLDGAMAGLKEAERICWQLGNLEGLQSSFGSQARILLDRGDLDGAMVGLKEAERICRQLGNLGGLQVSLGNQANILQGRGDLDGAMALHKEAERICRQLGNLQGLQAGFNNQANILHGRGNLDGAMALYKEAERICRQLGNLQGLQLCLGNQANILDALGDLNGAMALHKEAERICRQLGNLDGLPSTLCNQANILYARGDLDGAMALHKEAERICRQLGNLQKLQSILTSRANILCARGDLDGAMALHKEAERICGPLGNLDGISLSLGNQANILCARGDLVAAMALHKEEERICRQLRNMNGLSRTLGNQANILYARGDLNGAMALYKEAEQISRQLGNLDSLSHTFSNQAIILYARGDLNEAMALHKQAEQISRQLGNLDGLQSTLSSQANILGDRGDLEGAMALHKEAERICRQLGNLAGLSRTLGNQADILYARGDLDAAMALHKEAERICRQLGNLDGLSLILGNRALILQARGDIDGAMALLKEAEQICRQLGKLDGLQSTLSSQANILYARGDLDRAMALHKETERICRQLGNLKSLSCSLGNQAFILEVHGNLDGAMTLHQEAERIFRQLGNLDGLSRSLGNQANILYAHGDWDGAMTLSKEVERICRQLGNLDSLQLSLGTQANILYAQGDSDAAMALHKEAERICRQLGNLSGLSLTLGNQANVLYARGDLDGGMALHKEGERICRQLGKVDGLARSLVNQALLLQKTGRTRESVPLAEEAHQLATSHGYAALAKQIEPIMNAARKAPEAE
jgi:tetratricopeptide (TPR) repeat protein